MTLSQSLAMELRVAKVRRRITNADLALAAGVSPRQLVRILNGERRITVDALFGLCAALGVEPADILRAAKEQSS